MEDVEKQQRTKLVIDTIIHHFPTLKSIQGITGFSAGFRRKGGQITDEICIVVSVERKRPLEALDAAERIPTALDGIGVDVIEKPDVELALLKVPAEELENRGRYRPLKGGCQITNGLTDSSGSVSLGTLGCMIFIPAYKKKNQYIALLSNHHVMFANGGSVGQAIGQPSGSATDLAGNITDGRVLGDEVDVAIAKLASGVEITNDVIQIGGLTGFSNGYVGQHVQKYGRTTEYTEGQITDVGIFVLPDPPYVVYTGLTVAEGYPVINDNNKFADLGDSGSVLVDFDNKVVGLVWAISRNTPNRTFANDQRRLRPVEDNFQIPVPGNLHFQMQQIFSDRPRLARYGELLGQTWAGRQLYRDFVVHTEEAIRLVNEQRESMVAWQRLKGPAFISLIKDLDPEAPYVFERSIDGVAVEDMIRGMAEVFRRFGSKELVEAVERHENVLVACISKGETVEEVIAAAGKWEGVNVTEL